MASLEVGRSGRLRHSIQNSSRGPEAETRPLADLKIQLAVSVNWGVHFLGVLLNEALPVGSVLGPLIVGNCHVGSLEVGSFLTSPTRLLQAHQTLRRRWYGRSLES